MPGTFEAAFKIGEKCTGCTACVCSCPVFAINGERGKHHEINSLRCVACGVCGRICPSGAISDGSGKVQTHVKRSRWQKPGIDKNLCSACGICVQDCTSHALCISLPVERGDISVFAVLSNPAKCTGCGICERHCPLGAIVMSSGASEGTSAREASQ